MKWINLQFLALILLLDNRNEIAQAEEIGDLIQMRNEVNNKLMEQKQFLLMNFSELDQLDNSAFVDPIQATRDGSEFYSMAEISDFQQDFEKNVVKKSQNAMINVQGSLKPANNFSPPQFKEIFSEMQVESEDSGVFRNPLYDKMKFMQKGTSSGETTVKELVNTNSEERPPILNVDKTRNFKQRIRNLKSSSLEPNNDNGNFPYEDEKKGLTEEQQGIPNSSLTLEISDESPKAKEKNIIETKKHDIIALIASMNISSVKLADLEKIVKDSPHNNTSSKEKLFEHENPSSKANSSYETVMTNDSTQFDSKLFENNSVMEGAGSQSLLNRTSKPMDNELKPLAGTKSNEKMSLAKPFYSELSVNYNNHEVKKKTKNPELALWHQKAIEYVNINNKINKIQRLSCTSTLQNFEDNENWVFLCPSTCIDVFEVEIYGTDIYRDDSSICRAATHSGLYQKKSQPEDTLFWVHSLSGQVHYLASTRNGISSMSSNEWPRSFSLSKVAEETISKCQEFKIDYRGIFENDWRVEKSSPGNFWQYEQDSLKEDSIKFVNLALKRNSISLRGLEKSINEEDDSIKSVDSIIIKNNNICNDGKLSLSIKFKEREKGTFGIIFRFMDKSNFLLFEISPFKFLRRVRRSFEGTWHLVSQTMAQNDFSEDTDSYIQVSIEFKAEKVMITVNGSNLFSFEEKELLDGSIGFLTKGVKEVYIKDVELEKNELRTDTRLEDSGKKTSEEIDESLSQMIETLQFFINKCIAEGNSDNGCEPNSEDCHVRNCKSCCQSNTHGNSACLSKCEILD